jgi:hypothetical protein
MDIVWLPLAETALDDIFRFYKFKKLLSRRFLPVPKIFVFLSFVIFIKSFTSLKATRFSLQTFGIVAANPAPSSEGFRIK